MGKVLVTGASGFIGSHLVNRLVADGYAVRALIHEQPSRMDSRKGIEIAQGDVLDASAMEKATSGCDTVFHLAGKVHDLSEVRGKDVVYRSVYVNGTRNVLEALWRGGGRRFIFFSSVSAIGNDAIGCLDESSEPRPLNAYGRAKLEAEQYVLASGKRTGLHVACLLLPAVYGPGNKGQFPRMISAIDRGFFPPIRDMENRRSLAHVSNVVEAALLVATCPAANGQRYIVTDEHAYSTRELYEMLCEAFGKRVPRWCVPGGVLKALGLVGDGIGRATGRRFLFDSEALDRLIGSAWYSCDKIFKELGYRPKVAFKDALPELVSWYRSEGKANG